MSPARDHHIDDLQHLRGVSILMVFFTHIPLLDRAVAAFPHPVSNPLWLGVEAFFVLSGYVITNALARDRYEPLSFLVRRVFRLTPALLCFLLVAAGVFAVFLYGGVPDADITRVHSVPKAVPLFKAAEANGWDRTRAWNDGWANRPWDEVESGWADEAVAGGMPADEAAAVARAARLSAERKWDPLAWEEFGKKAVSVLGTYYVFREQFVAPPPDIPAFWPMWSLGIEDHFYVLVGLAALVAAVGLRGFAPRVFPWVLGVGCGAVYVYVAAVRFDLAIGGDYWGFFQHTPWHRQMEEVALNPLPRDGKWLARIGFYPSLMRFEFLPLGVLVAFFDRRFGPWVRAKLADRGPFLAWPLLLTPLAVAALSGAGNTTQHFGWVYLVTGWCYAPLVLIAAHNRMLPAARGRWVRVLRYLGDRSYTLYLLHMPLMALAWYLLNVPAAHWEAFRPFTTWMNKPGSGRFELLQTAVTAVLLFPLTELVYRRVELPLTRLGKRWGQKVRIIPPDAPAPAKADPTPAIASAA